MTQQPVTPQIQAPVHRAQRDGIAPLALQQNTLPQHHQSSRRGQPKRHGYTEVQQHPADVGDPVEGAVVEVQRPEAAMPGDVQPEGHVQGDAGDPDGRDQAETAAAAADCRKLVR